MIKNFARKIGAVCALVASVVLVGCGGSGDDADKITLPFGRSYNITCEGSATNTGVSMTVEILEGNKCRMTYVTGISSTQKTVTGIYVCGYYNKEAKIYDNVSFQYASSNTDGTIDGIADTLNLTILNFPVDGTPGGLPDPNLSWSANISGFGRLSGTGATIRIN